MTDDQTEQPELARQGSIDQRISSNGGFSLPPPSKKKSGAKISLEIHKGQLLRIVSPSDNVETSPRSANGKS